MIAPNLKALDQARANVAARYNSRYHVNAILGGSWDRGYLVRDELQRLLKEPERSDGDD